MLLTHFVLSLALVAPAGTRLGPCDAEARRALDFWVGKWTTVNGQGQPGGESVVEAIVGGCAVLERFTGPTGFIGAGIHTVDSTGRGWKQYWVDSRGVSLVMTGHLEDGGMTYDWMAPGVPAPQRYRVSPRPDGTVLQVGYLTKDGGKTWAEAWSLTYKRVGT